MYYTSTFTSGSQGERTSFTARWGRSTDAYEQALSLCSARESLGAFHTVKSSHWILPPHPTTPHHLYSSSIASRARSLQCRQTQLCTLATPEVAHLTHPCICAHPHLANLQGSSGSAGYAAGDDLHAARAYGGKHITRHIDSVLSRCTNNAAPPTLTSR